MALVFMDGFDHYAANDVTKKWDYSDGYMYGEIDIEDWCQRRVGTKFVRCYDHYLAKDVVDTVTGLDIYEFVVGAACRYSSNGDNFQINLMNDVWESKIKINITSAGKVQIWRHTTLLEETPQDYVSPDTWFHLEAKVVLHDTTGSYEVRLNEVTVLSGSGIDTNEKTGGVAKIKLAGGLFHYSSTYFDDFFLLDGNASDDPANPNNDFLGDCRIDTLYTNAVGTYTEYSPIPVVDNYLNVDDGTFLGGGDIDDDTTYNESSVVDSKETYNMDSISSLGRPIYAIAANSCCKKTDAGIRYFKQLTISNVTNHLSEEKHLTDNYKVYQKTLDVNPADSLAWEEDDINAIESGTIVTL